MTGLRSSGDIAQAGREIRGDRYVSLEMRRTAGAMLTSSSAAHALSSGMEAVSPPDFPLQPSRSEPVPPPLEGVRVLIVDDCTLHRDNLAALIATNGAAEVAVAWNLESLTEAVRGTSLAIILLNVATADSAILLRAALELAPYVRVVVVGISEDDELGIVSCAEAGAAGYHTRGESIEELLVLMSKVDAGESVCSPRVSGILLRRLSALAGQRHPVSAEFGLTARESEILRMLELGLSNREIADQLCIAVHTVKNHVHSLLNKLGVTTRGQAAALAHTII